MRLYFIELVKLLGRSFGRLEFWQINYSKDMKGNKLFYITFLLIKAKVAIAAQLRAPLG
jgi:hypothetical protein